MGAAVGIFSFLLLLFLFARWQRNSVMYSFFWPTVGMKFLAVGVLYWLYFYYYPAAPDIESALKDNFEELRPGSIAAISINGRPKDSVVILAEMKSKGSSKKSLEIVKSSVISFVLSEFSVEVRDVILGKKNMLPKTTSGKLRRTMYKEQYLNGSYS